MLGTADCLHNAFTDTGDDRFFCSPADQLLQVGAHRHASSSTQLNAIATNPVQRRSAFGWIGAVDYLRIDTALDGFVHVAASQIDGGGDVPGQIETGLVSRDDGADVALHVAAHKTCASISCVATLTPACTMRNFLAHDHVVIDFAELHTDHIDDADFRSGQERLNPQLKEVKKYQQYDHADQQAEQAATITPISPRVKSANRNVIGNLRG